MMLTTIVLFALAAVGGTVLTWMHLRDGDAPLVFAAGHGVLAAAGLVLLIWSVLQGGATGTLWAAVVLFVLAALGGFYLMVKHLQGESLSSGLMLGHGGAAVVGLVLLLIAYF